MPQTRQQANPHRLEVPIGINTTIGSAGILLAALACMVVPRQDGIARLVVLAAALAWFAAACRDSLAVLIVLVVAFVLMDGFLVNREGLLSWHGWPDVWRLAALAGAAAAGLLIGRLRRWE